MSELPEVLLSDLCQSLDEILKTMDVPEGRKNDLGWLMRNLAIRNKEHKDFRSAVSLIKEILKMEEE